MPGTVQVSILEITGLPSSKSSSSISIQVSLGKNSYEAEGEKADFLFPLATLRDNLVVKIHGNQGNEIAHIGVKTRLIVEKGLWDDLFPLEGGGHIHMRLKFALSEEERNRIRDMREAALRKKQEELMNKNNKGLQGRVASSGGRNEMPCTSTISDKVPSFDYPQEASTRVVSSKSVQATEDDQLYNSKEQIPLVKTPSKVKEDDQTYSSKEQSPLENTRSKLQDHDQPYDLKPQSLLKNIPSKLQEDNQPYNLKQQIPLEKTPSKIREDDQPYNLMQQSSLEKITSKTREDDQPYNLKEQSPLAKTPSKALLNLKEQSQWKITLSKVNDDDQCDNLKKQNPLEKSSSKVRETIAAFESSRLTQGLMSTEKAQSGTEISNPHPKEYKSEEISNEEEPKGKYPVHYIFESKEIEPSNELQRPSNLEQNKISERDHDLSGRRHQCSCPNFHGWIFLEESICSCIMSDNRVVIDVLGDYSVNPKTYPGKLVDEEVTSSKGNELSGINKKPDSSHSSGDGASRGPNGQLMKIVVMVGFGLLVLFTRQRKSR